MSNILLLGAGRRVSFAERLKDKGFKVFSYETEKDAPIGNTSTLIEGLKWEDDKLYNHLSEACSKHKINLILPMDDKSTTIAHDFCGAYNNNPWEDHYPQIDTPACLQETANLCYDKQKFDGAMNSIFPDIYPSIKKDCPVIIKPRFGFASNDIRVVSFSDWNNTKKDDNCISQRYIENGREYTVDAYFDKNNRLVDCVPRIRLRVAGGEVIDSITTNHTNIKKWIGKISNLIKFTGPVCFQFVENSTGLYIMEINARFGGGCILSLEAGFDMIEIMKQEYVTNKEIGYEPGNWKRNLKMRRVYREFFYENSGRP